MGATMCSGLSVAADHPVAARLHIGDNIMSIKWQARAGATYQVQGSNDLKNWNNYGGTRVGPTGNSTTINRSYRHYRVMELKGPVSTKRPETGDKERSPTERGETLPENPPAPKPKPTNEVPQKVKPLPKDFKSLKVLAEKGDVRAQYNLGAMYARGDGIPEDNKEAVKWWRKAAKEGDARSQFNLAVRYTYGKGVDRDAKEALRWYRKAAMQGHADAQNNLGLMYDNGEGVLEDDVTAYAWYNIAAANEGALAQKNKGIIANEMTPEQIAEAQKLSRELLEHIAKKKAPSEAKKPEGK